MNTIAIAIKINERQMIFGASWATKATLKALARYKLAGLKRKIEGAALKVAMAIIPLPQYAVA